MGKHFKERRESMKKKILYILIVIIMLLFGICIIKICEEKREQQEIVVDEIEHKIVFIFSDISYSEGYNHRGYFIDNCGDRYYYNLSDYEDLYSVDLYYEYLNEHIEEYEKEPYLEKDQLYEAYKHLLMIDKNAEKEEENISVDYGYIHYYGIRQTDEKEEIILLKESGDYEITVLDKNIDGVLEIIDTDNWLNDIWEKSNHCTD